MTEVKKPIAEVVNVANSSNISKIAYTEETQSLDVTFTGSGRSYTYFCYPPDDWEKFKTSPSKGKFFATFIKNKFSCRIINPTIAEKEDKGV